MNEENKMMQLKFEARRKNELLALDKYDVNVKDGSITVRNEYPQHPVPCFQLTESFDFKKAEEVMLERDVKIAKSIANDITIPGPAPQENNRVELKFEAPWKNELLTLDKYDVNVKDESITVRNKYPEYPVPCFKVTEGFDFKKAEEVALEWDIKVSKSIPNDIIIPDPAPQKIFLDTIRLLAENTNNLLQELWNYIEDGKIIQSAVLLLAAQEQIRGGCSSKINGSRKKNGSHTKINGSSKKNGFDTKINSSIKKNGFDIINKCVVRLSYALKWEKGSHGMAQELLEERKTRIDCAWLLVDVISHAGEDLSAYIQAHSEVQHEEVFQHVSYILKEYGFSHTGDFFDTINLRPYDCRKSNGESCKGLTNANMAVTETDNLDAAEKKAVRKKSGGGWDPTYTKRSFFPYWRSVLLARFPVKVYPAYASADPRSGFKPGQLGVCLSKKLMANGTTPTPNHKLGPVQRIPPLTSNNQPRRCFFTAATGAFRLMKVLK